MKASSFWAKTQAMKIFWNIEVYSGLLYKFFSEYIALERAYNEKRSEDLSLIAWRVRNLFELYIWASYIVRSEDNARRLYEDAGRDAHDLFKAFATWGDSTNQGTDWTNDVSDAQGKLSANAKTKGITDVQQRYSRVDDIAKQIGMEANYRIVMKSLSKLAHPTALFIIGNFSKTLENEMRDVVFAEGYLFFSESFDLLEQQVMAFNKRADIEPSK